MWSICITDVQKFLLQMCMIMPGCSDSICMQWNLSIVDTLGTAYNVSWLNLRRYPHFRALEFCTHFYVTSWMYPIINLEEISSFQKCHSWGFHCSLTELSIHIWITLRGWLVSEWLQHSVIDCRSWVTGLNPIMPCIEFSFSLVVYTQLYQASLPYKLSRTWCSVVEGVFTEWMHPPKS